MRRRTLQFGLTLSVCFSAFLCGFNVSAVRHPRAIGAASVTSTTPLGMIQKLLRPAFAGANSDSGLRPPDAYHTAIKAVHRDYFGPKPGGARLTYAAIDGMLETIGDPYTVFWTPAEYRENMETNSGDFVGIGTRLDMTKNKEIEIIEALEDSPAAAAGMQAGDIIVAIAGKVTVGVPIDDAIDLIKGPEGSTVRITVLRGGKNLDFTLKRAVVHARIVEFRMVDDTDKVGYIQLGMFNEQADVQFDAALAKLEKQGMRALVFDLRDNPGGLLQIAQDLASRFIADGPIVWVKEKNGQMSSLNVETDKHRSPLYKGAYPVVVLVNDDSASAAEIVSGAIQDSKAGVLLGTRTYGKGLVQTIMPLADDSAVKITTQHYFTRDQHDLNIKRDLAGNALGTVGGIKPDIELPFTAAEIAAQRAAVAADPRDKTVADKYDPQLQRAIQVLDGKLTTTTSSP